MSEITRGITCELIVVIPSRGPPGISLILQPFVTVAVVKRTELLRHTLGSSFKESLDTKRRLLTRCLLP